MSIRGLEMLIGSDTMTKVLPFMTAGWLIASIPTYQHSVPEILSVYLVFQMNADMLNLVSNMYNMEDMCDFKSHIRKALGILHKQMQPDERHIDLLKQKNEISAFNALCQKYLYVRDIFQQNRIPVPHSIGKLTEL